MPEVRRNRLVGEETMKITVVGALAIAVAIIVALLLIREIDLEKGRGSDQS